MKTTARRPMGRKWKRTTIKVLSYMERRRILFEGAHDMVKINNISTRAMTSKKKKTKRKKNQKGIANKLIKMIK